MRRQTRWTLALAFVAFVGTLAFVHAQDERLALPAKDWKGQNAHKVLRIVDGDTVVLSLDGKETTVRLIGVDTPETVHPSKPVEQFGKEASRFTANLLKGESVYVEYDQQKTDKYDRTLAYLYRAPDGIFVNLEIVRQGYGHAYTKYPFKYMEQFRRFEKDARESQRGLWSSSEPVEDTKPASVTPTAKSPSKLDSVTVYVTKTGQKYHAEGCRFLAKSKTPIALDEARKKYEPCSVCKPPR